MTTATATVRSSASPSPSSRAPAAAAAPLKPVSTPAATPAKAAAPRVVDAFEAKAPKTPATPAKGDAFQAASTKKAAVLKAVPAPVTEETPRVLSDAKQRQALAMETTQVNEISLNAENSGDICGGASMVNAMVLNSGTPAAAKANAAALAKAADLHNSWGALPPSVDKKNVRTALTHLGEGKPSEQDVHYLQQLAYATGRVLDPKHKSQDPGLTAGQLGGLAAQLTANGAQLGDTRFVQVKGAADSGGHWVVQSGALVANSLPSVKVGAAQLKPNSAVWDSDVRINKDDGAVELRMRRMGSKDVVPAGKAYVARLDPRNVPAHPFIGTVNAMVLKAFDQARSAGGKRVE